MKQKQVYEEILSKYGDNIPGEVVFVVLGAIQDALGYLPRAALEEVSRRSGISRTRLYGAVTAYPDLAIGED